MRRPSDQGYCSWSESEAFALVLSSDELMQFKALCKRGGELAKEWNTFALSDISPFRYHYKDVAGLRRQAKELEQQPRPTTDYPPPFIADPKDRFGRLRVEIRVWEREIAEVYDTIASPTALRHHSDLLKEKRRQWKEEERRRRKEEEEQQRKRKEEQERIWRDFLGGVVRPTKAETYAVLGLPANATEQQIKARYRELVKQHHPDIIGGDGARMREINAAYNALMRP